MCKLRQMFCIFSFSPKSSTPRVSFALSCARLFVLFVQIYFVVNASLRPIHVIYTCNHACSNNLCHPFQSQVNAYAVRGTSIACRLYDRAPSCCVIFHKIIISPFPVLESVNIPSHWVYIVLHTYMIHNPCARQPHIGWAKGCSVRR